MIRRAVPLLENGAIRLGLHIVPCGGSPLRAVTDTLLKLPQKRIG